MEYFIWVIFLGGYVVFFDDDLDSEIFVDDFNLLKNCFIFDWVIVISVGVIVNLVFVYFFLIG